MALVKVNIKSSGEGSLEWSKYSEAYAELLSIPEEGVVLDIRANIYSDGEDSYADLEACSYDGRDLMWFLGDHFADEITQACRDAELFEELDNE